MLLSVSLSREVVPAFARILLHTSLGKKHMVRPLLRTEITQVINRRAWYDVSKLTSEVLSLYKVQSRAGRSDLLSDTYNSPQPIHAGAAVCGGLG